MPDPAAAAARFGEPRVVVDAHLEIGVRDRARRLVEQVREPQHRRVRRCARAPRGAGRSRRRTLETRARRRARARRPTSAAQPDVIAFVQRHQADEAHRPRTPRRHAQAVDDHGRTIAQGFCAYRDARHTAHGSRTQAALDALAVDDAARDLLDRALGRVDVRDAVALEQVLGAAHLELALRERRVAAAGPALVADLLQPRAARSSARTACACGRARIAGSCLPSKSSSVNG